MPEKPILIIHPNDKTTAFLDRIKNHLIGSFGEIVSHFNIYPNDNSHLLCLQRIQNHPASGMIIFLGHGRTDKLYGSKGTHYENREFVSQEVMDENPDDYYFNDNFIDESNLDVFADKKVFCLACNSNSKLAKLATAKQVKTFIGFGDIPTSLSEFKQNGQIVSQDLVKRVKGEINYIIKTSLALCIKKNMTVSDLLSYIKIIANQRISTILTQEKNSKERFLLADYIYYLKKEVVITGDKNIGIFD